MGKEQHKKSKAKLVTFVARCLSGAKLFFSFFFSLCWITSVLSNPLWPITSRAFARKENVFKIPHRLEERMIVIFLAKLAVGGLFSVAQLSFFSCAANCVSSFSEGEIDRETTV